MMKMLPVRQTTAPLRSRLRLTQPQLQAEPRPLGSGRRASVYFRGRLRLVHPSEARTSYFFPPFSKIFTGRVAARFTSADGFSIRAISLVCPATKEAAGRSEE